MRVRSSPFVFALAISAVLLLVGCLRTQPTGVNNGNKIGLPPLSLISTAQNFPPATLTNDFNGNFLSAHADHPLLTVLDGQALGRTSTTDIAIPGESDPWGGAISSVGRGGQGYLLASDGAFFTLDGNQDIVVPLARVPATSTLSAWVARRDDQGVLWADTTGSVHQLNSQGQEIKVIPTLGNEQVDSIASGLDGKIFTLGSVNGTCTSVRELTLSASESNLVLGSTPCLAHLSHDGQTLWVAGATSDGGTQVMALNTASLKPVLTTTEVHSFNALNIVVADDNSRIALLSSGPNFSVAVARLVDMQQNQLLGDDGVWRRMSTAELAGASDGLFDDSGNLFLANPTEMVIDTVY